MRKQTSTDFFVPSLDTKIVSTGQYDHNVFACGSQIENMFYSENNSSKLCTEGAIRNLMNVLDCFIHDMDLFWNILTSPLHLILHALDESSVPKAVQICGSECVSIK